MPRPRSRLSATLAVLGISLGPDGRPRAYWGSRSLLSTSHLAAVLDGRWEHWGWHLTEAEHQRAVDDDFDRHVQRMARRPQQHALHRVASPTPATSTRPCGSREDPRPRRPAGRFVTPV